MWTTGQDLAIPFIGESNALHLFPNPPSTLHACTYRVAHALLVEDADGDLRGVAPLQAAQTEGVDGRGGGDSKGSEA